MATATVTSIPVIPFQFESHELRTIICNEQPWFVAMDVCASLDLKDTNKALLGLDEDQKREHEHYSGSGRKPILINESGLYCLILRSRKPSAKRFTKWVTSEVLPAIRKHGRYEDTTGKMETLIDQTIGTDGFHILQDLITKKTKVLPIGVQRQAKSKLWSVLHTRFNVPRADLISADDMDSACNFVAAYALEGEYLAAIQDDDHITINLSAAPGDQFDKLPAVRLFGCDVAYCSKLNEMFCMLRNAAKNEQYVRVMDIEAAAMEVSGLRHHLTMACSALEDIGRQTSGALRFRLRPMY